MRGLATIGILLCCALHASADPFTIPPNFFVSGEHAPGSMDRAVETLALAKDALQENPGRVVLWDRVHDLLQRFGRTAELEKPLRAAWKKLNGDRKALVGGVLGRVLITKGDAAGGGGRNMIVIINGNIVPQRRNSKESIAIYTEAIELLEAAVRADQKAVRARQDLANAFDRRSGEGDAAKAKTIRLEAAALQLKKRVHVPTHSNQGKIAMLLQRARALEVGNPPQHDDAAKARREALVLTFCENTIPFKYDATLFESIAQLATSRQLRTTLTRYYTDGSNQERSVPPVLNLPSWNKRVKLVRQLGQRDDENSVAALLALLTTNHARGPLGDDVVALLSTGARPYLDQMLPSYLASTLTSTEWAHRVFVRRRLVEIVRRRKIEAASPALLAALADDHDTWCPLDAAAALGAIGDTKAVSALLAVARDPDADVYFRRQAVLAVGAIDVTTLNRLPDEPHLALHIAAARYRSQPDEALRGRILGAIGSKHQTDDAAKICVDLGITDALPLLEAWLGRNPKDRVAPAVTESIRALREL